MRTAVRGFFASRKGRAMEKGLCYGALGVAALMLLLFLLDLFLKVPFSQVSSIVDILGIVTSGVVLYLAYDAYRDLR